MERRVLFGYGLAFVATAILIAACGDEARDAPAEAGGRAAEVPRYSERDCSPGGRLGREQVLVCFKAGGRRSEHDFGSFVLGSPGSGRSVPVRLPDVAVARSEQGSVKVGHWSWGAVSPDQRTLLAVFTVECEVPRAYLVSARGGTPRLVPAGAGDPGSRSAALGWTPRNRALVIFTPAGCGRSARSRLLELSPQGAVVARHPLSARQANSLRPSTAPRPVGKLLR